MEVTAEKKWDKYDTYFLAFRLFVLIAVCGGTAYFLNIILQNIVNTMTGVIAILLVLFFSFVWIFLSIGVACYLIFFTRNTFRMYFEPTDDTDDLKKEIEDEFNGLNDGLKDELDGSEMRKND